MTSHSYDVIVAGVGAMGSAASAIGEILADLSTSGQSTFDLRPFSLGRFAA